MHGSSEEFDVLLDQRFVDRPMLRIELVKQLHEKPVAASTLELRAESLVDLGRETLIFPLEFFNQVLVQRDGHFALSRRHTRSVPE